MGAGMPRCGRSVAMGLPKIISAGDGSPVSIGVARRFNSVSYGMSSTFLIVFRIIGLMRLTSFGKSVARCVVS